MIRTLVVWVVVALLPAVSPWFAIDTASAAADPQKARIERGLARTDRLLVRVARHAQDCHSEASRARLSLSLDLQAQARLLWNDGEDKAALRLSRVADELAREVLVSCTRSQVQLERVEREIGRTEAALDRMTKAGGAAGGGQWTEKLGEAFESQSRARQALGREDVRAALRHTKRARAQAAAALRTRESSAKDRERNPMPFV
jgi:hypothetical protein